MGFDFTGYVIRPPQIASTNAPETAEPTTGVVREAHPLPQPFVLPAPEFVDVRADQYRTAVLNAPGTSPTEYLLWAQNTSSLALIDDPSWWLEKGTGFIPTGETTVIDLTPDPVAPGTPVPIGYGFFYDGATRLIVRDNGERSIGSVLALVIARGDIDDYDDDGWVDKDDPSQGRDGTNPYITLILTSADYNVVTGVVDLTRTTWEALPPYAGMSVIDALGGGLSVERGDQVLIVRYTLAPAKFWWTRNDRYETRFGWSGTHQRWEPYKGTPPQNVGILQPNQTYTLNPKLKNLPVNSYLPGNATAFDEYAMIRVGVSPGLGDPVSNIRVRPNSEVESDYDFALDPNSNGIVGQANGILQLNPAFVTANAGKTIWYTYKGFQADANGVLGKLLTAATEPLYLAPIPGPTDFPLLRLGSRHHLQTILVETEADLGSPLEGEAQIALSTGRVQLSLTDIRKSDPTSATFGKNFFGEDVIYDGVALNQTPQPTTKPVPLVDATGTPAVFDSSYKLYIPGAALLPTDFGDPSNIYRGLGSSGVLDVPDGTGVNPANFATPASVRPGGDTLGDVTTGRVRQVLSGVGDTFVFSRKRVFQTLQVVDRDDDLPSVLKVKKGTVYASLEATSFGGTNWGSVVRIGRKDSKTVKGDYLYFLQAEVTPAVYTEVARIYSRNRDIFRFSDNQIFQFSIDGTTFTWTSPTGQDFYTPEEVADSITAIPLTKGRCYALNGRVVLEADDPLTESIEIGWNNGDLSGAEILGFLPGWRVQGGVQNWLPDSGVSFGMFRSPVNLDRSNATPDIRAELRVEDIVLVDPVQAIPFVFLTYPPLQDVAGYDEGVFFNLRTVIIEGDSVQLIDKRLVHYVDIIHRFGQGKFDWVWRSDYSASIEAAVDSLALGAASVVPESLLGAPGIGGGLYVSSDGGAFLSLVQGRDYLLPQDGIPGIAQLVEQFGGRVSYGARGSFVTGSTTFTDPDADFSAVQPGYRLKVQNGSFTVQSVTNPTTVAVVQPFPMDSASGVVWEMFEGYLDTVYDPTLLVDMKYQEFNHIQSEPFVVRLLSNLGTVAVGLAPRANMQAALSSGRPIFLRYGIQGSPVTLIALTQQDIGDTPANGLQVPTGTDRFTSDSFSICLGTQGFAPTGVAAFTPNLTDGIEYLMVDGVDGAAGTLKFGTNVLSEYDAATVYYVEEFQPHADVAAGTAEYDPLTGDVNLSGADVVTYAGERVYFVEQMITEFRKDVALNPILGSFAFNSPVPQGCLVEVSYWLADLEGKKVGNQITEFLPTFVRSELAVRQKENVYLFNTTNTVLQDIEPTVYIGPIQQNFGQIDFLVDYPAALNGQGRITFVSHTVPDYVPVTVSYAIYEAQGGERAYDASQRPLYRPPFFITANKNRFGLRGNRTTEFVAGQMFRFGEDCFYVKNTSYYPDTDVTAVYIFPSTVREVGSRSPANDVVSVVTFRPVTTVVDPDGTTPVATTAASGFMSTIDLSVFPFEPVSCGQKEITFTGNLTQFAVAGHIFEIGGYPHTISSATLNDDGTRTKIFVTSGFQTGFNVNGNPTVKLSYRPVYPPELRETAGIGPILAEAGYELVLFEVGGPGGTLRPGIDYELVLDLGVVQYTSMQPASNVDENIYLAHTELKVLQPFWNNGVVSYPRYAADFLYGTIPDDQNGFLGANVTATYTYSNPDSFYLRVVRLPTFLAESAQEAIQEIKAKAPASGTLLAPTGGTNNWEQGRRGIKGERVHLTDKDRAARTLLSFYNQTIVSFEQVLETISGGFIGDRDGKFRFFVGRGKNWYTPGYEDAIKGTLTPRNIWSEVFIEANPNFDVAVLKTDWLVNPVHADLVSGKITGWLPSSSYLAKLLTRQKVLVHNEVDDEVVTAAGRKNYVFRFPKVYSRALGIYKQMWEQHKFSRLFPTMAHAFTMTAPGVGGDPNSGDFGVYTWGREVDGEKVQTTETVIAQLQNPTLGDIGSVSSANLKPRYARGRVWGYFQTGIPATAFGVAITDPCVIAVPALLRDVLIDPATGYPDPDFLISQGGDLPDSFAGDPDLAVPGFQVGDQLAWGKPDGTTYKLVTPTGVSMFGQTVYTGVFVAQVQYGCVLTFQDSTGALLTDPNLVLVATSPDAGVPLTILPAEQGDTVYAGPASNVEAVDPEEKPTFEQLSAMSKGLGTYRDRFDLLVQTDGSIVDMTFPSWDDPVFGFKEMVGQNPPPPMSAIEGKVSFTYESQNPLKFPALEGLEQDDSGDYQIPYLKTGNTELDRFDELGTIVPAIIMTNDVFAGSLKPVYPDEALGSDGSIVVVAGVGAEPATLLSSEADVKAWTNTGNPGTGDVDSFDLLLVQPGANPSTPGASGIHTVGSATWDAVNSVSLIEPPRFQTYTADLNDTTKTAPKMRYAFENYAVYVDPTPPVDPQIPAPPIPPLAPNYPGVVLIEDTVTNAVWLDFQTTAFPILNDGATMNVGGLNDIVGAISNNFLRVDVYARTDPNVTLPFPLPPHSGGDVVLSIYLQKGWAWSVDYLGTLTGPWAASALYGHDASPAHPSPNMQIQILPIGGSILPWNACPGGSEKNWVIPHSLIGGVRQSLYGDEFALSINTVTNATLSPPIPVPVGDGNSDTAWVAPDRLTFNEVIDLRRMKPRDYTHPVSSLPLESSLHIAETYQVDGTAALAWSTLLSYANGGLPFTFLERNIVPITQPLGLGTWVDATVGNVERGSVKVMAFEGWMNAPITGTDVTFSAVPSNPNFEDAPGPIFDGTGKTESKFNGTVTNAALYDDRVTEIAVVNGSYANVVPGDILVIKGYADLVRPASTKTGTYLIRHAVEENDGAGVYRGVSPQTTAGSNSGWCPFKFPRVVSFDTGSQLLTVTPLPAVAESPSGYSFAASGRLYIVRDVDALNSEDPLVFAPAVISADYTLVAPDVFDLSVFPNYTDALGNALTVDEFYILLDKAYPVSGMTYLPMHVGGELGLPQYNCVGWDAATTTHGVQYVTFRTSDFLPTTTDAAFAPPTIDHGTGPALHHVAVEQGTVLDSWAFIQDKNAIVYPNVPALLTLNLDDTDWKPLNVPPASAGWAASDVDCLLPGTQLSLEDLAGPTAGFLAQAGVFLEPSFPRSTPNLVGPDPMVVDDNYVLPDPTALNDEDRALGMRNAERYYPAPANLPDEVSFEVRRIRRFHGDEVGESFLALRYAYEIRRGVTDSHTITDKQRERIVTLAGTNLGYFDDPNVNIHAGDTFRLLDVDGNLLETAEILGVESATVLKLASQLENNPDGLPFEIYIRQTPVPHEQSNEELLDLITERVVLTTNANWTTDEGGYCVAPDPNQLRDNTPGMDFAARRVKKGDIVIIDPMGAVPQDCGLPSPQEVGQPPLGDDGVPTRIAAVGKPSDLDDNRGYYRVKKVVGGPSPYLELDPVSTFAGGPGDTGWVIFGPAGSEYGVYPTISDSVTISGFEGQMDLRPTHYRDAGTRSFANLPGELFSMAPFSYRIIRPSALFTEEAVDLVLLMRERMLTLIERLWFGKYGSYYIFQRDEHISDLGSFTDSADGLGVMSNAYIESLLGNVGVTPFLSNEYCMSLLDRRFWILDNRLDSLTYLNDLQMQLLSTAPGQDPYTAYNDDASGGGGEVRPVLPDRINQVLDESDRFRAMRYIWLSYRVHKILGTLAGIRRYDEELPERLEAEKNLLLLTDTVEKVTT